MKVFYNKIEKCNYENYRKIRVSREYPTEKEPACANKPLTYVWP